MQDHHEEHLKFYRTQINKLPQEHKRFQVYFYKERNFGFRSFLALTLGIWGAVLTNHIRGSWALRAVGVTGIWYLLIPDLLPILKNSSRDHYKQ